MKLLIIYTNGIPEVINRKSALGSYIFCLADLLNKQLGIEVHINGTNFQEIKKLRKETPSVSNPVKYQFIRKLIPKFIKRILVVKSVFRKNDVLKNELLLINEKYDAILEFYTLGSETGFTFSKAKLIPLYLVYDSPVIEQEKFFNGYLPFENKIKKRELNSIQAASKILVYSNPVREFLIKEFNLTTTEFIIHQNVDYSRLDIIPFETKVLYPEINICFLGSFLKWHRIDLLIDVFEKLCKKGHAIQLYLIGDGMEYNTIVDRVNQSSFSNRIHLTGYLDGKELMEMKSKMDIGVMPGSNWYGAPNKIFEYGASGIAVISCSSPTIDDIFNDQLVVKFKMGDANEFEKVFEDLIKDRKEIAKKAELLQKFILDNYNEIRTMNVYQNFLSVKISK